MPLDRPADVVEFPPPGRFVPLDAETAKRRAARQIIAVAALTVAAILAVTGTIIWEYRQNALTSARQEIAKLDRVIVEQTARAFDSVDVVVASVVDELKRDGITTAEQFQRKKSGRDTYEELRSRLSGLPQLDAIVFVNAKGDFFNAVGSRYPYRSPAPPINVADRDYFTALRDNPQLERFINKPVQSRDGTATWLITLARPLRAQDGSFIGLVLGGIRLEYFEDFYRDISLGAGSSIALWREDGTLLARYPAGPAIIGKPTARSQDFRQILGDADSALIRVSSPLYGGEPRFSAVGRVHRFPLFVTVARTEESIFAQWRSQTMVFAAAGATGSIAVCLIAWLMYRQLAAQAQVAQAYARIEHEKAVQAALRESQDRLNRAQRLAGIGSAERDLATGKIHWSDETYRIYGVDRETFTPTRESLLAMIHPDDRDHFRAIARDIANGARPPPLEYRIVRSDGETRWLYREHEAINDANGKPTRVVGTVRDVTEQRLTEQRLVQAQKMEAIGNLTGGMAHDFNNLLSVIIGNLGLLRDEPSRNEEDKELLKDAFDAALRGADLTRRLLAFARRQPLQPRLVEANELLERITALLRRTLGENIETNLDLAPTLWPIRVDPVQLEAAIANLSTNARDAMCNGGKLMIRTANRQLDSLYVAQHADIPEGDYVLIEVCDTGGGMSPETQARIFDPFFTTKEVGKGSGLGLSMVFGFIKQSGGHIRVYSELGKGTCFRLYLPRAKEMEEDAAAKPAATEMEKGGHERVLVAEDNELLRSVVAKRLNDLGY